MGPVSGNAVIARILGSLLPTMADASEPLPAQPARTAPRLASASRPTTDFIFLSPFSGTARTRAYDGDSAICWPVPNATSLTHRTDRARGMSKVLKTMSTFYAVFRDASRGRQALERLLSEGVPEDDVSLVSGNHD